LERTQDALLLKRQGVLYAPDYVVNSGGAISAAFELGIIDQAGFERRLCGIGQTLSEVFRVARTTNITSTEAARRVALGKLGETGDGDGEVTSGHAV
jgi:leucine dehydrogenase